MDPRTGHDPGRYRTPDNMEPEAARSFMMEFLEYLERDGRHNLWIMAASGRGLLAYDRHEILYAYGPLEGYEQILKRRGFRRGRVTIPVPTATASTRISTTWRRESCP